MPKSKLSIRQQRELKQQKKTKPKPTVKPKPSIKEQKPKEPKPKPDMKEEEKKPKRKGGEAMLKALSIYKAKCRRVKEERRTATKRSWIGRLAGTSHRKRRTQIITQATCRIPHRTIDVSSPSGGNTASRTAMKGE